MIVSSVDRAKGSSAAAPVSEQRDDVSPWDGLDSGAAAVGVHLSLDQLRRFRGYRDMLRDWNTRVNLTAVTDPAEIERRLILDSLRLVPPIDRLRRSGRPQPERLIDVGSGAGFPGLAIKIARPEIDVTLVEATGKKVAFLREVSRALDLHEVTVIHARAEDLARERPHRETYDLVTARAVASLPALIELGAPLLRLHGHGLFPKGLDIATELAAAETAASLVGVRLISDERLAASATRLIVVEKIGPTPDRYPRRSGIPAREPLGVPRSPTAASRGRSVSR